MTPEIALAIFIFCLIGSRILNEKAMKVLSVEEKAKLVDAFSGMRAYSFIPIAALIAVYYFLLKYSVVDKTLAGYVYFALLVIYIIFAQAYVFRKFAGLDFPKEYIRKFKISRVMSYVGLGTFFYVIMLKGF